MTARASIMGVAVAVDYVKVADGGFGAARPYMTSVLALLVAHIGSPAEEAPKSHHLLTRLDFVLQLLLVTIEPA